jgi:hypothetical protein
MTEEAPNTDAQTAEAGGDAGGATRSTIARPWLVRIVIITLVLVGYGVWSVYDAYVSYPERGADYASWSERAYLLAARDVDESREQVGTFRRAAVDDPASRLEELGDSQTRERNLQDLQGTGRPKRAQMELALEEWLTALDRIGRLHPAYTSFHASPDVESFERLRALQSLPAAERTPAQNDEIRGLEQMLGPVSPRERLTALETRWTSESQPSKLQSYDIPVNKLAAVICFGFSVYLIALYVGVAIRTYTWDPTTRTLTLPSGESIGPDDLADIDKRKWDKFIVFLLIKESHKTLGGKEVKVDTYRHGLVEGWILDMEKTAFPERAEEEARAAEAAGLDAGEKPDAVDTSVNDPARAG